VPFGVELPELKWLPTFEDAVGDLRHLPVSWDSQKVTSPPTWWSSSLRTTDSSVDGHAIIENAYTARQYSLIRYPVRWEPGDKEADVLARYYAEFGELPEEFRYEGAGKHRGITRDKVLIDRGLDPGGFSQPRCWPLDEPGRVINGAGPYMLFHPDGRLATNREVARVMGFPDAWKCGSLRGDKRLHSYWGKGSSVAPGEWVLNWLRESLDGSPGSLAGELQPDGSYLINVASHWRAVEKKVYGSSAPAPLSPSSSPASPRQPRARRSLGSIPGSFTHRDCDRMIVREVFEQRVYEPLLSRVKPGDVVLDLGAHIGCFTRLALEAGARVIAVEMLPGNLELLSKNTAGFKDLTIISGAVTNDLVGTEKKVTAIMARNPMGAFVNGTKRTVAKPSEDRSWQVSAIPMLQLMASYWPAHLKFDIEASEYGVIWPRELATYGVSTVTGEYHVQTEELLQKAQVLQAKFTAAGYTASRQPPVKPSGWGHLVTHILTPSVKKATPEQSPQLAATGS
jgi:FkbM family methyltransferase